MAGTLLLSGPKFFPSSWVNLRVVSGGTRACFYLLRIQYPCAPGTAFIRDKVGEATGSLFPSVPPKQPWRRFGQVVHPYIISESVEWTQIAEGPMDSYKPPGKAVNLEAPSLASPTKEFSDSPRDIQGVQVQRTSLFHASLPPSFALTPSPTHKAKPSGCHSLYSVRLSPGKHLQFPWP